MFVCFLFLLNIFQLKDEKIIISLMNEKKEKKQKEISVPFFFWGSSCLFYTFFLFCLFFVFLFFVFEYLQFVIVHVWVNQMVMFGWYVSWIQMLLLISKNHQTQNLIQPPVETKNNTRKDIKKGQQKNKTKTILTKKRKKKKKKNKKRKTKKTF